MDAAATTEPPSETQQTTTNHPLNLHCHDLATLQDLACRGAWRSILDKVLHARKHSLLTKPHEHLIYLAFNSLALTKLRRFTDAVSELADLEDLDSPNYQFQCYPDHYGNKKGSMVPFVLRWLHADLPARVGNRQETLDRLYTLLNNLENKEGGVGTDLWIKRRRFVVSTIISHHLGNKEFGVCLDLIRKLVNEDSGGEAEKAVLMSKLGYIQMQFGDLDGARTTFGVIEGMVGGSGDVEMRNLVGRNKALVYLVGKDYVSAVREYDECIERDGSDVVSINNKALCLMYLRDLSDSIKVLENALERVPTSALNETFVVNLCSMYELAYVNHSDIKRTLSNWIARVAPDDFDTSCTRI